ncbi:MAG: type II secretion system F family protein [Candidatus Micrarchaeota archaeon]|nr:type II secretion system F family protein [Candidatus Micrarchaeota archaeon]
MLFKKKGSDQPAPKGAEPAKTPLSFTKPRKFLFFKIKSRPIYTPQSFSKEMQKMSAPQPPQKPAAQQAAAPGKKYSNFQIFIAKTAAMHKDLEISLREQGIRSTPYDFVKRMFKYAAATAIMVALVTSVAIYEVGLSPIFGIILGVAIFYALFNKFIQYPIDRSKNVGTEVERDILFAMRDIVIGMRSGMPLFNAMTAVSTGYGAASREFAKVVEQVQLGLPIEQAIDEVSNKSTSKTFKRMMLQASVSIKSGADIVAALQSVLDEVAQERVIELRRYGQRLNALAMFYMLFGVIFPSMGIAIAAILTTFINIFTVDQTTLIAALVFIFFLQIVFLNIMRGSRPVYAM